MDRILLFIPMYNCGKQIPRVIKKVKESTIYDNLTEILVIDNQSNDNSLNYAIDAVAHYQVEKCKIVQNIYNVGLGGSHKSAFSYAMANDYDYVIVLHGDDQGSITDLEDIIKSKNYHQYDAVLGSRFMRKSKLIGYSRFRIIGNVFFNIIVTIICGRTIKDLGSGLNLYKVSSLKEKYFITFPDNLIFNVFMLMAHASYSHKVLFVPISWREDDQISNVKLISQTVDMTKGLIRYFFKRKSFLKQDHRKKFFSEYFFREIFRLRKLE